MRVISSLVFALTTLSLAACGGGSGDDIQAIDATGGGDGSGANDGGACTISTPNFGDKGTLAAGATIAVSADNAMLYKIAFTAPLEPSEPQDIFFFELFTGYAPFGTQETPTAAVAGTYRIETNQLQYEDCSVCLTLGSNATADGYDDDFMATGGTVTIEEIGDAAGENLNVTFTDLTFEQVTISEAHSTPVGNGCNTAISNATFTGTLAAAGGKPHGNAVFGPLARTH